MYLLSFDPLNFNSDSKHGSFYILYVKWFGIDLPLCGLKFESLIITII